MPMNHTSLCSPRFSVPTVFLVLGLLSGCVDESVSGNTTTYRFSLWIPTVVTLVGFVPVALGALIGLLWTRYGWLLVLPGLLYLVVLPPAIFLDRLVVSDTKFEQSTGFWFVPTQHFVSFGELSRIDIIEEQRPNGSASYYLNCIKKNGSSERVPINDMMQPTPLNKILTTAQTARVPVIDTTGGNYLKRRF